MYAVNRKAPLVGGVPGQNSAPGKPSKAISGKIPEITGTMPLEFRIDLYYHPPVALVSD